MKTTIWWKTKDPTIIKEIEEKFNLPSYRSINGETPIEINDSDLELLRIEEKKGNIQLRNK